MNNTSQKNLSKLKNEKAQAEGFMTEVIEDDKLSVEPHSAEDHAQTPGEDMLADLVYPASKYHPECSPSIIYLPSNQLMLRILRASLFVEKKADSVFYNDNHSFHKS